MKTIITYLLIASVLIASCTEKEPDNQDSPEEYVFPLFLDNKTMFQDTVNVNWLYHGNHYPMYFGNLTDTIIIHHRTWPMWDVALPPGSEEEPFTPEKGEFDDYYLDWLTYRNYKRTDSVELDIQIDTSQIITNNGRRAYPVLIQNLHTDTIYIGYGDHIPIITEAVNEDGEWKPIEYQYTYMCGNGLNSIILPPNQFVVTSELIYSGTLQTRLRIKFGKNYSREFNGSINKSQFESEWDMRGDRNDIPNSD